jgi:subtilisin family serine protease
MKRLLLLLVILLGINAAASGQRNRTQLIVTLKDGQSIERINRDNSTTTLKHIHGTKIYLLAQEGHDDQALRKLKKDSRLQTIELNSRIELADNQETVFLLDDSADTIVLLDAKTILNGVEVPQVYARQRALSIIEADQVRAISTGAATRVATIDTGVDFNHSALRPWLDAGADLVNGRSASEYDSLTLGDNQETIFLLDTGADQKVSSMPSAFGHGTLVAGVIHLVAPDAVIVPIKAFDAYGRTSMFTIVEAVYRAMELNADIINMSFSTGQDSLALRSAINKARAAGIAVVSSMGNGGQHIDNVFPAAYTGVYGVAATDFQDQLAAFSNYGKTTSISAPGSYVITTAPGGRYAVVSGTSFSAPLVSGAISLLAALQNRGNQQGPVVVSSAEPIDSKNPGFERMLGKGRLNARLALEQR